MNFNERLKMYRNNLGFTQKAVAEAIGISLRGYQQYEQGKFEPDIAKLIKLADTFGITIDELVGHELPQNPLMDPK